MLERDPKDSLHYLLVAIAETAGNRMTTATALDDDRNKTTQATLHSREAIERLPLDSPGLPASCPPPQAPGDQTRQPGCSQAPAWVLGEERETVPADRKFKGNVNNQERSYFNAYFEKSKN